MENRLRACTSEGVINAPQSFSSSWRRPVTRPPSHSYHMGRVTWGTSYHLERSDSSNKTGMFPLRVTSVFCLYHSGKTEIRLLHNYYDRNFQALLTDIVAFAVESRQSRPFPRRCDSPSTHMIAKPRKCDLYMVIRDCTFGTSAHIIIVMVIIRWTLLI